MCEWTIENVTEKEMNVLEDANIDWYPDNLESNNICIYCTESNIQKILEMIGR